MTRTTVCLLASLLTPVAAAAGPFRGVGPIELVQDEYANLDTPTWLPHEKRLVFADVDKNRLFQWADGKAATALDRGSRGKVGPDGWFYGLYDRQLVRWRPGKEREVVLARAPGDREISLNDLVVSASGRLYFTTLKDPAKGRVTVVDVAQKTAAVAWDAENEPDLVNPNGVALSADEKFLYVGVSNYANKGKSAVYRFPVNADGSLEVAAGKKQKWAAIPGTDGIAVDRDGNVWVTVGAEVRALSPDGKPLGTFKLPKGSGSATNLGFGGEDGGLLFVTTKQALYQAKVAAP